MTRAKFGIFLTLIISVAMPASAQGPFGSLVDSATDLVPDAESAEKESGTPDETAAAPAWGEGGDLMQTFVTSQSHVLDAQIQFANAFDLADQVALLEAEKEAIGGDTVDRSALQKTRKISNDAQTAINQRIEEQPELDEEGSKSYQEGLMSYGLALLAGRHAVGLASDATGSALGMVSRGRDMAYVVKETPGYFGNLVSTGKMLFQYGQRNDIEPPEDATSLLGSL